MTSASNDKTLKRSAAGNGASDSLPPWPSEPPPPSEMDTGDRSSGLIRAADLRVRELEEKIASLEEARAADAETISRQANNLTTLRESSLVQIRRLSSLERELDAARTSVASTSTERDNLRTKAQKLEEELGAVRSALALAESATRDAQQALEGVVRALAAAPRQEATLALVSDVPRGAIIGDG